MLTFLNKHWKIILIFIMTILLGVSIVMIIKLEKRNNDNMLLMKSLEKKIIDNNIIYEKNKELLENLEASYKDQKVIVVTTKEFYERIKKTPINTDISDVELLNKLKKFESDYRSKK